MKRKPLKGSAAWYDDMAKSLNKHIAGMQAVNKIPKFKKVIHITEAACSIAKYCSTAADPVQQEIDKGTKLATELMESALNVLIKVATEWLDGQYNQRWSVWYKRFASGGPVPPRGNGGEYIFSLRDLPGISSPEAFDKEYNNHPPIQSKP